MIRLRARAELHERSIEEEIPFILRDVLWTEADPPENLYEAIRRIVAPYGGIDLPDIPREAMRDPPDFSED